MILGIKRLYPNAKIPNKAHDNDLGFDFYSLEYVVIRPHETKKIKTGIALDLPKYPAFGMILKDRSSLGSKGIKLHGGCIDPSYTGEIIVCLCNTTDKDYFISVDDKICQGVLVHVPVVDIQEISSLPETDRGDKGFGSSGAKF